MNDDSARDAVLSILRDLGLDAEPIPELPEGKTPDLLVTKLGRRILVEVKSKDDDQQLRELLEAPSGTQLSYKVSSLDTCVRNAWRQIHDFPERRANDLALIWFIARKTGGITILAGPAMKGVLYGTAMLEGRRRDGRSYYKECYFFSQSVFFKRKELAGVVLHNDESIALCLNPFSTQADALGQLLRTEFTLIDPAESEAADACFIADCDSDRANTAEIVRFLKDKYSLGTVSILNYTFFNLPVD